MITIQEFTIESPPTGEILTLWRVSYNDLMEIKTDTWQAICEGLAQACKQQGFVFTLEDEDIPDHQLPLFSQQEGERTDQP